MKKRIYFLIIVALILTLIPTFHLSAASSNVGKLTIFSDGTGTFGTHSFIYVENTSSTNSLKIGSYNIGANRGLTLGTWGNKNEHNGLWYNLEAYYIQQYNAYNSRVSLTMNIDANKVKTINTKISNGDSWSYTNNCAGFALSVWNSVASKKIDPSGLDTPAGVASEIKKVSGYTKNKTVCSMTKNKVYYAKSGNKTQPSSNSSSFQWKSSGCSK